MDYKDYIKAGNKVLYVPYFDSMWDAYWNEVKPMVVTIGEYRPYYTDGTPDPKPDEYEGCCLVEVEDDSITMVAVDGFRLARRSYHPAEPTGRLMKFVVPADALREVEKILADTDEPAIFTLGPRHILFEMGATTLVCRVIEGEFMDWRRVMPEFHPITLCADVSALTDSIERVSLIVTEKLKSPVRCVFSQDRADFRTTTTLGAAHDVCTLSGDGKDLEIGFNCRYLLEALRAVPTEEVMLELSNALSPIVLTPCEGSDKDFAYMVLPVRLKAQ
jgi:DNA polymerase-3 subunit beta